MVEPVTQLFPKPPRRCGYCGGSHAHVCPRIKSIEYFESGEWKHVELWPLTGGTPDAETQTEPPAA